MGRRRPHLSNRRGAYNFSSAEPFRVRHQPMRVRKSSLRVSVVLVGTAALTACDGGPRYTNRDIYASAEECQKDLDRPTSCEPGHGSVSGGPSRVWYGPSYHSYSNKARSPRAVATTSVSRAGFSSASSFHRHG